MKIIVSLFLSTLGVSDLAQAPKSAPSTKQAKKDTSKFLGIKKPLQNNTMYLFEKTTLLRTSPLYLTFETQIQLIYINF